MNAEFNFYRNSYPLELTTFYTVPQGHRSIVTAIDIVNRGSTTGAAYLYLVSSGDTAGVSNALFNKVPIDYISIPASDGYGFPYPWKGWEVLNSEGATIQGYCSGTMTIHINGFDRPLVNI